MPGSMQIAEGKMDGDKISSSISASRVKIYSPRLSYVLTAFSLAGFQVTTIGRFWVTAEESVQLV
jgi:hypothetical protein